MISIIIPTIGDRPKELKRLLDSLDAQTYKEFEVILVTQLNHDCTYLLPSYSMHITQVKLNRKGLSYARNEGLKYINGSIVTFSDDDCWYPNDALQHVISTFEENAQLQVACFQIYDPNKQMYYKNYSTNTKSKISRKDLLKISSIEFFINLKVVPLSKLKFDEDFGLGTKYPSGEENIFLMDLIREKTTISYFPHVIVYHKKPDIHTRLTNVQIISKGPLFKRLTSTSTASVMLLLFFMKKAKHIEKPLRIFMITYKEMLQYKK